MKTFSTDLTNLLATKHCIRVDLFQIGPCMNGQTIYATNGSGTITFNGNVYQPVQFGNWSRAAITLKVGMESNTVTITVKVDNQIPVLFPGTSATMLDCIKFGLIDQAPVSIFTAYMPSYGVVVGPTGGSLVETKFVGQVGTIEKLGLTKADIQVNDLIYLLNVQTPQMILQAACRWTLYGTGCTLNKGSFSRSTTVGTVVNPYIFTPAAAVTPHTAAGTFTQGYLTWTSGQNLGLSCFIRNWVSGGAIQLDLAPIFPMAAGDAFTIYQGCSKSFAACNDFGNSINYGGTPNVPVPEAAI